MSQPSHFRDFFLDNVVTSGHQARTLAFYKGTHRYEFTFPFYYMHPMPKYLPHSTSYTYITWTISHLGNNPNLREVSPIGHPETFSKPNLSNFIMTLSIFWVKGGLMNMFG
jgi:hypothetical protein